MNNPFHGTVSHATRLKCVVLAAMVVLTTSALSGCGSSKGSSEAASGSTAASGSSFKDTLVIAKDEDVTSLDPQAIVNQKSFSVYCNLYEGLVRYNSSTHEVEPCLATDWTKIDDTTYHFNLRQGVKFHDGNTMTSQDVIFSFERALESGVVSTYLKFIDKVEADGDYAVTMHTKVPYAQIVTALSNPSAVIVSKAAVEKSGEEFAKNPVGTGPYMLNEWKAADEISLVAFDDYWGEPAKTKNVVFKVIPEGSQRTIMLENGEADIACAVLPNDASRIEEDSDLTLVHEAGYKCMLLYFKCNSTTPVGNKLVRQAIQYAINKQQIVDAVINGYGQVGALYATPLTVGYNADKDKGDLYDPEKAKSLLSQAGYPNGFKLDLYCSSGQTYEEIATILQSQLAEVNIDLNVLVMESNTINEKFYNGEEVPIRMGFYNNLCGDTDLLMQKLLPDAYGQVYFNDQITALMNKARAESDSAKRQETYDEFWDILIDDMPWLTVYYEETIMGLSNNVQGFVLNPVGATMYNNVAVNG